MTVHDESQKTRTPPKAESPKPGTAVMEGVPSESELMERRSRRKEAKGDVVEANRSSKSTPGKRRANSDREKNMERRANARDRRKERRSRRNDASLNRPGQSNGSQTQAIKANVDVAASAIVAEPVQGDGHTEELQQKVIEQQQKINIQQEEMTNMQMQRQTEQNLQLSQKERINQLESEHLQERHNYKKILLTSGATVLIVAICVILALVIPESRSVSGKNAAIDSPTPAPFLELQSEETCEAIANDDGTYTFEFVEGVEIEVVLEVSTDYETDIDEIMPQVETFVQEELLPYLSGCAIDDSRRLLAQAVIGSSIRGSRALETYDSNIIVFARIVDPIEVDGLCSSAVGGLICRRLSTLVKLYYTPKTHPSPR